MSKVLFTDNDAYFAMLKSMNEDMNIDPYWDGAIEAIDEIAEKNEDTFMRWWGMVYNFNGLDVQNLINPVFQPK